VLRIAPAPAAALQEAALADLAGAGESALFTDVRQMMVQSLLRHAMAEAISDGIINCLIVTSSAEANIQLTRIHEHLFARTSHPSSNRSATLTRPLSVLFYLHFALWRV